MHARNPEIRDWLTNVMRSGMPIVVSWDADTAVLTDTELFIEHWDDFCYPASDDVTVLPAEAPGSSISLITKNSSTRADDRRVDVWRLEKTRGEEGAREACGPPSRFALRRTTSACIHERRLEAPPGFEPGMEVLQP
jgi:hypothetical protein